MKKSKPLFVLLAVISFTVLASCAKTRIKDRYDEEILTQEEDRFNLYKQANSVKAREIPGAPSKPQADEKTNWFSYLFSGSYREKMRFYSLSEMKGLQPLDMDSPDLSETYSIMAICWNDNAPVLRFWQRYFNSKAVEFSFPLNKNNSREISRDASTVRREIIISLRQGTMLPWIMMDDYEIFRITVNEDLKSGIWTIEKVDQLTDNRYDDVQALLSESGGEILFTTIEDDKPSVNIMDASGGHVVRIAEKASMPFYLPASNDVIFVKEDEEGVRDFYVYQARDGKTVKADTSQIVSAIRTVPYTSLKSKYMTIGAFRRGSAPDISGTKTITYSEIISSGLRGSPEILRDYYEYESSMARTVENLYDQGPDAFFSSYYLADNYIFLKKPDGESRDNVGDVISMENFLRLTGGMTVPVIPNVPLKLAEYAQDRYGQEAARLQFLKTVNTALGNFNSSCFEYILWENSIEKYSRTVEIALGKYEKFRIQREAGYNINERVLFAENEFNAAQSEYNNAVESFIGCQYKLYELLGLNIPHPLKIEYPEKEKLLQAPELRDLEWFQAQAQINHPDIQRMNFMLLGAAAIRDMGPPALRSDGVKVSITYGYGIDKWSKAIDDFLLLGLAHAFPLRLPVLGRSYYDNWSAKIESLRNEKFRIQGEIKTSVHAAYKDIVVLKTAIATQESRTELFKERFRIGSIYDKVGNFEFQTALPDALNISQINDTETSEIELLKAEIKLVQMRSEYFKRLSALYSASGISAKLVSDLLVRMKPEKSGQEAFVNGIYLMAPLEIIRSKEERNAFLSFCEKSGVNEINCLISSGPNNLSVLEDYAHELRYFLNQCAAKNISVNALIKGEAFLSPAGRKKLEALTESILRFNKFQGIDLDIKPFLLPEWKDSSEREKICDSYLAAVKKVSESCGRNRLSIEIPLFLKNQETKNGNLPEALSIYAGAFNISSLRTDTESVEAFLEDKKISARINAQVDLRSPYGSGKTLSEIKLSSLSEMKNELCGRLRKFSNFGGSLINDYELLKDMKN